ncbi:MAG: hypothetical protein EXQ64_05335 [Ilumatobacteraceae bacterium]|nr:hypothetical protein [Ilumatobacteraceae bacterium]
MTEIEQYIQDVHDNVDNFVGCSPEQALVYSCEAVTETVLGVRKIPRSKTDEFINSVCMNENIETPTVNITPSQSPNVAIANIQEHSVCLHRARSSVPTILHEIAHLTVGLEQHGVLFRDELIRLTRKYIGVEYSSLLFHLMSGTGLEMSPWQASSRQIH